MQQTILYARKQILPSQSASILQSMNMAAAFAQAGNRVYSYPGVKASLWRKGSQSAHQAFLGCLEQYGLNKEYFGACRPVGISHKGLYGAYYRAQVLGRYMRGNDIIYTRDVSDALYVSRLRALFGKRGLFLFEMHEALFALHKAGVGKCDWERTRDKEIRILSAVDGVVVINPKIADSAREELGYSGPILVEPSGFNSALFNAVPLFTAEYPWPDSKDAVHLAYVGNMLASKGVAELIQAMALLPPRFHLRVIGGGAAYDATRELSRSLGLENRVRFFGYLPQKDLRQACLGCHMAVIPQQPEVDYFSPLKFMESLALGLPLVITPLPVFEEIKHLAHVAADCSPPGIAVAIESLAAAPGLAEELRLKGLEAARSHTWQAKAERILAFAGSLA